MLHPIYHSPMGRPIPPSQNLAERLSFAHALPDDRPAAAPSVVV